MSLFIYPKFSAQDVSGVNLSGGKVYFYEVGTSTPKDTYSDSALTIENANPVVLDSRGEANIYLSGSYKVILEDADNHEIWTVGNSDNAQTDIDRVETIAKNSAGNGIYNGLLLINQKTIVLNAGAIAATNDEYPIDMHKTILSGVSGTQQWLSTNQPTGINGYSLKYVSNSTSSGQIGSRQIIEKYARSAGLNKTYGRWVRSNSTDARIIIDDGVTKTAGSPHTGGGGWELLTVTATINASPTKLECHCVIATAVLANASITSGDYIEFTDARLDLGEHRLSGDREYGEESALCQRYYQTFTPSNLPCMTNNGGAGKPVATLLFPVVMRSSPSFSVSGTWLTSSGYGGTPLGSAANEHRFSVSGANSISVNTVEYLHGGTMHFTAEL